jgi:hypothetical protein
LSSTSGSIDHNRDGEHQAANIAASKTLIQYQVAVIQRWLTVIIDPLHERQKV